MDHELYCMKPEHRFLSQHPTVGDDLPNAILAGRVKVCNDVERFTETAVVFKGSDERHEIDAVIFATGYNFQMTFMDKKILEVKNNEIDLYRRVFPPRLPHATLCVIGFVQPHGATFPTSEMQARWATKVFTGQLRLPSIDEMLEDIEQRKNFFRSVMVPTQRHTVDCNFVEYINEMASLIDAKPNMWKLAITDPKLFWACLFGPCVPYQFRLQGPHAWEGARDAILTVPDRIKIPLKTRDSKTSSSSSSVYKTIIAFAVFVMVVLVAISAAGKNY